MFLDWTTKKAPQPPPAAPKSTLEAKGVKAGMWKQDLPPPNSKKRKGDKNRESEVRKRARKQGETATMTMAIDQKTVLSTIWRDETGCIVNSDFVALKPEYTLEKAQMECISRHDACERTVAKAHNRGLAIHLGQKRARKFAEAGSLGDSGLGPIIDADDLPTDARQPKLIVEHLKQTAEYYLRLARGVRAGDTF